MATLHNADRPTSSLPRCRNSDSCRTRRSSRARRLRRRTHWLATGRLGSLVGVMATGHLDGWEQNGWFMAATTDPHVPVMFSTAFSADQPDWSPICQLSRPFFPGPSGDSPVIQAFERTSHPAPSAPHNCAARLCQAHMRQMLELTKLKEQHDHILQVPSDQQGVHQC